MKSRRVDPSTDSGNSMRGKKTLETMPTLPTSELDALVTVLLKAFHASSPAKANTT